MFTIVLVKMINKFIDAAILHQIKEDRIIVVRSIPSSFSKEKSEQFIRINSPNFSTEKSIFVFTVPAGMCYSIAFPFNNEYFMITVVSKERIPHLFCSFLLDAHKDFTASEEEISPVNRLDYIYAVLNSWRMDYCKINDDGKRIFEFHSATHNYKFGESYLLFKQYSPYVMFSDERGLLKSWKSLLVSNCKETGHVNKNFGNGVLVVGKTREELFIDVFAVASLVPFPYRGNILITTSQFDARLVSDEYDLVGVLEENLQSVKKSFDVILYHSKKSNPDGLLEASINRKNALVREILLYLMDRELTQNPFNDFFQGEYVNSHLNDEMSPPKKEQTFVADDFISCSKTQTVIEWRKSVIFRDAFRESFLSCIPEDTMKIIKEEDYPKIESFLDEIQAFFASDHHVKSVIKIYKKIISGKK